MDAFAFEPQFVDHIAPVWRELPADVRGTLRTSPALGDRARALGLVVEEVDVETIRLGGLTIETSDRCNRIDVLPIVGRWHTFFICGNCGRDLEVITTRSGFRHTASFAVLAIEQDR